MKLLSMLSPFNRRVKNVSVSDDRRDTPTNRLNAVTTRLETAIDDLCQTVTMSRSDFDAMIERDRAQDITEFPAFAAKCEFRYINGGTKPLCRNPEHERICTGLEVCGAKACPRLQKPE